MFLEKVNCKLLRKLFFLAIFCLSIVLKLNAQVVDKNVSIENLFSYAIENNYNIQAAKMDERIISRNIDKYWQRYIPSIAISTTSISDIDLSSVIPSTDEINSTLTISEYFPNGTQIELAPKAIFLQDCTEDNVRSGNLSSSYVEVLNLGMGISQSLTPYRKNGNFGNSEKEMMNFSKKQAEIQLKIEILNCFKSILDDFINIRIYQRKIDSKKEIQIYFLEKKKNYEELICRQNVSKIDLFSVEEELLNLEEEIKSLVLELNQYKLNLRNTLGFCGQNVTNENCDLSYFGELPECSAVFNEELNLKLIDLEKSILETEYFMNKRKKAPVVSIAGSIPLYQGKANNLLTMMELENSKKMTLSVSFDFSSMINDGLKQIERNYSDRLILLEKKKLTIREEMRAEKNYYAAQKESEEVLLNESRMIFENKKLVLNDYEILFERGDCSYLDLLEKRVYLKIWENDMENQLDRIWYFRWMELNCN